MDYGPDIEYRLYSDQAMLLMETVQMSILEACEDASVHFIMV